MNEDFTEHESILKQTRIDQGLSLEMVHEATKIPLDVLRAIEEGYKVRTLSPFYYKAFLKTYAKYLDVDPDEAVLQFKEKETQKGMRLTSKPPPKKDFVPPKSKLTKEMEKFWTPERRAKAIRIVVVLIGILIVIRVLFFIGSTITQWVKSWGNKTPQVQQVAQGKAQELDQSETDSKTQQKKTTQQQPKKEEAKPKTQPKVIPKKESPPPRPQPVVQPNVTSTAPPIGNGVSVTVRATRDAFLFVRADGETVFQSSLFKGAVETWNADDEIVISGKNIGYLEFEVNGRLIGGLSRGDAKAKKVIVSKNGLSVKK